MDGSAHRDRVGNFSDRGWGDSKIAGIVIVLAFSRRGWLRRAELLAISCVAGLLICGWYLIQNTVRYGSPFAYAASQRYLTQIQGAGMPFGSSTG